MEETANNSGSVSLNFKSDQTDSILSSIDLAVRVKGAKFSYGRSNNSTILRETNVRIPKGVIYALLGPSGCGKTTLLKALSNLIKVDEGEVLVFGKEPGSKNSSIPGSGLGYMPQEEALYGQLTVEEAILLFGKLHAVKKVTIYERMDNLTKLLELPDKSQMISKLSGGELRRISLACAMINNPKLLILDEPTVGVDPLLRKTIWNLMVELTQIEGTTIIITTHYIDEAKEANIIGMMRNGRILRESSPSELLMELNCQSLEQCFVEICKVDDKMTKTFVFVLNKNESLNLKPTQLDGLTRKKIMGSIDDFENSYRPSLLKDYLIKTQSLIWRNLILLKRNLFQLAFQFGMPGFIISLFCIIVGANPFNLNIAVVNDESPKRMSTLFIDKLDPSTLIQNNFNDVFTAIKSVENGENYAVLHIPRNFTKCLVQKLKFGLQADNSTIRCSTISSHMDHTNYIITITLISSFFKSYLKFLQESLYLAGSTELAARPLLDFTETVYGDLDTTYLTYILPNAIICCAFTMSILLTTFTFMLEKKSQIFDRFLVTGVSMSQILISHLCVQSLIALVQTAGFISVPVFVFGLKMHGSVILLALLTFLQGVIGMTFGLLVSSCVSTTFASLSIAHAIIFPLILLTGYIWPIEALPTDEFKTFSKLLCLTLPSKAFRSIFSRGWGLEHLTVVLGFVVSFAWILIHIILIILVQKLKK